MVITLKRKTLLLGLMLIFVSSILNLNVYPSKAQNYNDYTLPVNSVHGHPQLDSVTLDNGKFCYAYSNITDSTIRILVYSASGTLEASSSVDVSDAGSGGNKDAQAFSMIDIDSDNIIILYIAYTPVGGDYDITHGAIEYNTNSYSSFQIDDAEINYASGSSDFATSQLFIYDGSVYAIHTYDQIDDGQIYQYRVKYTWATDTLAETHDTSTSTYDGYIFGFTHINDTSLVYLIGGKELDNTRPIYCKWDLDSYGTEPEELASHGVAGDWGYMNVLSLRYLGGNLFWSTTELDYILYHYWTYSDTTYAHTGIYCNRLRFNATGIDSDYFEAQSRLRDGLNVPLETLGLEVGHTGGYITDKDEVVVWHSYLYALPTTYRTSEIDYEITDFDDFASSTIDYTGTRIIDSEDIPNQGRTYITYKDSTSPFLASRLGTALRIYYGLIAQGGTYDIDLVWQPSDNPLETYTQYLFIATSYSGSAEVSINYEWFINGVIVQAGRSSSQGAMTLLRIETIAGIQNFTIALYSDAGSSVYTESFYILFETGADDSTTSQGLITVGIASLMAFLPVFIVVLVPPFFFYLATKSLIVFFVTLITTTFTGTLAGLIPTYIMMLIVLLSCLFFFLKAKDGF